MHKQARLQEDLCRMARFGANLADAHSCLIFLPVESLLEFEKPEKGTLILTGFHSLSDDIIEERVIPAGFGLIGWVAKNHRSIHVSPFERDSRTLGIYQEDHELKSFIGIPIAVSRFIQDTGDVSGVIACDSRKAYAFSKLQGKLLEDLSAEISNLLQLHGRISVGESLNTSWETFKQRSSNLVKALGKEAVEVLRLRPENFYQVEEKHGIDYASSLIDQVVRLIRQTLPPHFPLYRTSTGDIVILLDNMMTSFFANKIDNLCNHMAVRGEKLTFVFKRASLANRKGEDFNLERIVAEAIPGEEHQKGSYYEQHRRA